MNNMLINRRHIAATVASPKGTETWLGKTISSVQEDVVFADGAVTGTLAYISGWSAYSADPKYNTGNFLCFKVSTTEDSPTYSIRLNNNIDPTKTGKWVSDADGEFIIQVSDKDEQSLDVKVESGTKCASRHYELSGLTCEES